MECKICNVQFPNLKSLSSHIVVHQITKQEYYDKFLKVDVNEGVCVCGNKTSFKNLTTGYCKFCSRKCSRNDNDYQDKRNQTIIQKFGCLAPMQNVEVRNKQKQTCLNKSDEDRKSIREKVKETNIRKYGVEYPAHMKDFRQKCEATCLSKYGVSNYFQTKEFRQSVKERMLTGQASYMVSCNKNPSKPQVILFNLVKELYDNAILNYQVREANRNIDIVIPDLKVAIEYDGSYWHNCNAEKDKHRQAQLENLGWKFLRYTDYIPDLEELKRDIIETIGA